MNLFLTLTVRVGTAIFNEHDFKLFLLSYVPMGFPPFQNLSLAFLKDDLQKRRRTSKRKSKKENCENASSGCFHTFPFLEEAIICLPCSHLAKVTLVKEMW